MTDKVQIEALYREMYAAMVAKDTATLNRVHADEFPFELSAVISKCDFVISDTIFFS